MTSHAEATKAEIRRQAVQAQEEETSPGLAPEGEKTAVANLAGAAAG